MVFSFLTKMVYNVDPLCLEAGTTAGTCLLCYQSYFDTTTNLCTAPTTVVANAISYSSATQVSICDIGYYLSGTTCAAVPTTCTHCADGTMSGTTFTPTKCTTGFSLVSGACVANTSTNCSVTDCDSCTAAAVCWMCGTGLTIVGTTTTTCTAGVANCYAGTVTVCETCMAGYYINAGTCT